MCRILCLFGSVCNLKQLPSKCEHCTKGLLLGSFDSKVDDMYTIYAHKFPCVSSCVSAVWTDKQSDAMSKLNLKAWMQ